MRLTPSIFLLVSHCEQEILFKPLDSKSHSVTLNVLADHIYSVLLIE